MWEEAENVRDLRRPGVVSIVLSTFTFLFLLFPLVIIIFASFSPTQILKFPPESFSLKWYENIFTSSSKFIQGLIYSLEIGAIATVVDAALGVMACLAVSRYSFKGRQALTVFFTSPMFVPSITFGFVLLRIFTRMHGVSAFTQILIGHVVIILPYIIRNTLAIMSGFDWNLEDASASLGAKPLYTFFHVTLPLVSPGVTAGALLAFLYSFDEAVVARLLHGINFNTLPVIIMNYMTFDFDPTVAAISSILIVASLLLMIVVERVIGLDVFLKSGR